jgi:(1->4)-alpha-D-glucan 1-alpha-D-glucosylmutase
MGLILDIVSNHMAVGGGTTLVAGPAGMGPPEPLRRVLRHPVALADPLMEGQLLLPFLGSDYVALQEGTLKLHFDAQHGAFLSSITNTTSRSAR